MSNIKQRHEYSINTAIVRSIPINKDVKRFFINKYAKMVKCNGPEFAADVFKTARDVLLGYRADPNRVSKRKTWLARMPFKINGWLVSLFDYMDTHPHNTINFIKLYCGPGEPIVSVEQSADDFQQVLEEIDERKKQMESTPKFLERWLKMLSSSQSEKIKAYFSILRQPNHPYHRYVAFHTLEEWISYWRKWFAILKQEVHIPSLKSYVKSNAPIPEMYKDFTEGRSETFDRDFASFTDAMVAHFKGVKPMVELKLVQWIGGTLGPDIVFSSLHKSHDPHAILADQTVGQVHHIPKSGTVGRRPIAVPNRYLQLGTLPIADGLNQVLRRLPKDSTFDQGKFISYSQARINKGHYVGSVDLSKATDNLPLSWFQEILKHIPIKWDKNAINSWEVFLQIARGKWLNGNNKSITWTVGQPLGTLPSFPILALTHNIFLESLSLQEGYGHSPYSVLGDDVLITKERLREAYIQQLTGRRVPLSLHKSYEHHLSEFAGILLVKNQQPKYTSDHKVVTYNNLFDYQNATKVKIPYDHLPKQVKNRIRSVSAGTGLKGREIYTLLQELQGLTVGLSPLGETVASRFFYYLSEESLPAQPTRFSSTVPYNETFIAYRVDHVERKIDMLPEWFERKFRPAPTDSLIKALLHSVRDLKA